MKIKSLFLRSQRRKPLDSLHANPFFIVDKKLSWRIEMIIKRFSVCFFCMILILLAAVTDIQARPSRQRQPEYKSFIALQSLQIHAMQSYAYHDITQYNHNLLLKRYPHTDGLKTGYVHAAGYHMVATAKRGDTRLIALVMGSRTPGIRLRETVRLLDEGFIKVNGQVSAGPRE